MIDLLEKLQRSRATKHDYPCLFDDTNIQSVYNMLDPTNRGFITMQQYKEGIYRYFKLALTKNNICPMDLIQKRDNHQTSYIYGTIMKEIERFIHPRKIIFPLWIAQGSIMFFSRENKSSYLPKHHAINWPLYGMGSDFFLYWELKTVLQWLNHCYAPRPYGQVPVCYLTKSKRCKYWAFKLQNHYPEFLAGISFVMWHIHSSIGLRVSHA